jgi:glutathione S-transferase
MRLHGYFRSSAAWRVHIALHLKGLPVEHRLHHLRRVGQRAPDWLRLSPQGLAPALETDGSVVLTQSMAICEWLDKTHPEPPLLPGTALQRARIRAFAQAIARNIRPVQKCEGVCPPAPVIRPSSPRRRRGRRMPNRAAGPRKGMAFLSAPPPQHGATTSGLIFGKQRSFRWGSGFLAL